MNETYKPVPDTVGKMIQFLQKFPKDYKFDLHYVDSSDYGSDWETSALNMEVRELKDYGSLEITVY